MSWDDLLKEAKKDVKKVKREYKPRKSKKLTKTEIPEFTFHDLKIKIMDYLNKHHKKYNHLLGHIPPIWGGRLPRGSGWSASWKQLLEIVAEILPDLIAEKI